jgi:hypothetical protein
VRVFRRRFTFEDAIEVHAFAPLEVLAMHVANDTPLGWPLFLPVHTVVHFVQPLKDNTQFGVIGADHELCHHTDDVTTLKDSHTQFGVVQFPLIVRSSSANNTNTYGGRVGLCFCVWRLCGRRCCEGV